MRVLLRIPLGVSARILPGFTPGILSTFSIEKKFKTSPKVPLIVYSKILRGVLLTNRLKYPLELPTEVPLRFSYKVPLRIDSKDVAVV